MLRLLMTFGPVVGLDDFGLCFYPEDCCVLYCICGWCCIPLTGGLAFFYCAILLIVWYVLCSILSYYPWHEFSFAYFLLGAWFCVLYPLDWPFMACYPTTFYPRDTAWDDSAATVPARLIFLPVPLLAFATMLWFAGNELVTVRLIFLSFAALLWRTSLSFVLADDMFFVSVCPPEYSITLQSMSFKLEALEVL